MESGASATALNRIAPAQRTVFSEKENDFHHLNKEVPTEGVKLEQRAEECVRDLYEIESEIFGYDISLQGTVNPRRPQYWPKVGANMMQVFLRQSY